MGWALPSQQQLWTMQQLAAQSQAQKAFDSSSGRGSAAGQTPAGTAQTKAATSYYGTGQSSGTQAGTSGGTSGAQTGGNMATTATQIPAGVSLPEWQQWYGQNVGKTMTVNGQQVTIGQDIGADDLLTAFRNNTIGWGQAGAQQPSGQIGGQGQAQPESVALQQMQQIDPTGEALRQGLGQSYLSQLAQTSNPTAADFQSYLDMYKQVDPQGYAQRVSLAGGVDQFVKQMQDQAALGSQLDPGTVREVEQGTRAGQIARGNVYGTPQLVAETMARGSAGEQRLLQRQQQLQGALGLQQGYLGAGLGLGDVAMSLYNQRQNQLRASQGAALGYLGSGQTPYQAGASYLNMAEQRAAAAGQGGPQYNPSSLGQQYTGAGAPSFPQYGLDMSQLAGNWYNNINQANLQAYGLGQAYGGGQGASGGQRAMGAGIGALGGAASGALAGSAVPGIGTLVGAGIGAIGGAASGYFK